MAAVSAGRVNGQTGSDPFRAHFPVHDSTASVCRPAVVLLVTSCIPTPTLTPPHTPSPLSLRIPKLRPQRLPQSHSATQPAPDLLTRGAARAPRYLSPPELDTGSHLDEVGVAQLVCARDVAGVHRRRGVGAVAGHIGEDGARWNGGAGGRRGGRRIRDEGRGEGRGVGGGRGPIDGESGSRGDGEGGGRGG